MMINVYKMPITYFNTNLQHEFPLYTKLTHARTHTHVKYHRKENMYITPLQNIKIKVDKITHNLPLGKNFCFNTDELKSPLYVLSFHYTPF